MTLHRPSPDDETDDPQNPQVRFGSDPGRRGADDADAPEGGNRPDAPASPYGNLFSRDDVARARSGALDPDEDDEDTRLPRDDDDEGDDAALSDDEEEPEARRPRIALIIGGVFLLAAIGIGLGVLFTRQSAPTDSQVVARVGENTITRGDFVRNYQPGVDAQVTLDRLIEIELVIQAAQRDNVAVDQSKVEEQVQQLRTEQGGGSEEQFQQFLAAINIPSETDLRTLLGRQQMIEAMVLKHTVMEQARSSHILLAANDADAITKRKSEAEALLAQVQGGADFAALAKEKSEDPGSKEQGGELGWVPRGVFVPEFEQAIFEMKPGEVRLVQSPFGWHIIKLEEAAQQRALENNQYLQTPAGQQAFSDTFLPWVEGLRNEATKSNQIQVLVTPESLVPTPAPLPSISAPPQSAPPESAPPQAATAAPATTPVTTPQP